MEIQNENNIELEFNKINEYISKKNFDYNFQNYENDNEQNLSEIIFNDKNIEFTMEKKFAFRLDLQIEDWVKNIINLL
jgi:hypothetical protein